MSMDLDFIVNRADGVVVLDGWTESSGARLEVAVARQCGKPVYRLGLSAAVDGPIEARLHTLTPEVTTAVV